MFSLKQKHFLAKRDGKDEVVLTMEEAEAVLSQLQKQDLLIAKYMDYVPEEVLEADMIGLYRATQDTDSDESEEQEFPVPAAIAATVRDCRRGGRVWFIALVLKTRDP